MKKTATTIAILSALAAGMVGAGEWKTPAKNLVPLAGPTVGNCLSYDFIDLEYGINEFGNDYFSEGESYGIGFSKSLGSTFFLTAGYADGGYDYEKCIDKFIGADTQRYRMGVGAHHEIAECVDLTFEGGAQHLDAEYEGYESIDYDSWSYYFGPGIRARAGKFEFFAKAFYTGREGDLSGQYAGYQTVGCGNEYGWVFTPGVIFHFTECLGFKVAAEVDENDTALALGVRYEF